MILRLGGGWLIILWSIGGVSIVFSLGFLGLLGGRGFKSPSELVRFQKVAVGDDRYRILHLDLLQEYVRGREGTYASKYAVYTTVRGFFKRNRAALPEDDFEFRGSRDPVRGRLPMELIRVLVEKGGYGLSAFYLTLWQSLMDQERFQYFNTRYGGS